MLNAFRHRRSLQVHLLRAILEPPRAQRLPASEIIAVLPPSRLLLFSLCSTPSGIGDHCRPSFPASLCATLCAQRLPASEIIAVSGPCGRAASLRCSTPSGIGDHCRRIALASPDVTSRCSTPSGIGDHCRKPRGLNSARLFVLNAFRHRRSLQRRHL